MTEAMEKSASKETSQSWVLIRFNTYPRQCMDNWRTSFVCPYFYKRIYTTSDFWLGIYTWNDFSFVDDIGGYGGMVSLVQMTAAAAAVTQLLYLA